MATLVQMRQWLVNHGMDAVDVALLTDAQLEAIFQERLRVAARD